MNCVQQKTHSNVTYAVRDLRAICIWTSTLSTSTHWPIMNVLIVWLNLKAPPNINTIWNRTIQIKSSNVNIVPSHSCNIIICPITSGRTLALDHFYVTFAEKVIVFVIIIVFPINWVNWPRKDFRQECNLTNHLRIHGNVRPHVCNICGKGKLVFLVLSL